MVDYVSVWYSAVEWIFSGFFDRGNGHFLFCKRMHAITVYDLGNEIDVINAQTLKYQPQMRLTLD